MGYYSATPLVATSPPTTGGSVVGIFLFPSLTPADAVRIMRPFEAAVNASKASFPDTIVSSSYAVPYPSFSEGYPTIALPQSVGFDLRLGSRLFDRDALTANPAKLNSALRTSTPVPNTLLGHLVAGPGPRTVRIPGGDNAVLPAWRQAYTHIILPRVWDQSDPVTAKVIQDDLRNTRVPALVGVAPNTGAYVNEADPTTPGNWQATFWGANYARLKSLKAKWDPKGVFFCRLCVGFEDWVINGPLVNLGPVIGNRDPTRAANLSNAAQPPPTLPTYFGMTFEEQQDDDTLLNGHVPCTMVQNLDASGHVASTEQSPLLEDGARAKDGVVLNSSQQRFQRRILGPIMLLVFLADFASMLVIAPSTRLFESVVCHNFYSAVDPSVIGRDGSVDEHYCKVNPVQEELAFLQTWQTFVTLLPGRTHLRNAITFSGYIAAPLVGSFLMDRNVWIPIFLAIGIVGICGLILLALPETLGALEAHADNKTTTTSLSGRPTTPQSTISTSKSVPLFSRLITSLSSLSFLVTDTRLLFLISTSIAYAFDTAATDLSLQYFSKRYNTSLSHAAYISSIRSGVSILILLFVFPALSSFLLHKLHFSAKGKDLLLARVSFSLAAAGYLLQAVAPSIPLFILGMTVAMMWAGAAVLTKSLLSELVARDQVGRVFTVMGLLQTAWALVAEPLELWLWKAGLRQGGGWIGLPFGVTGGAFAVTAGGMWALRLKKSGYESLAEEEREEDGVER
ncbi:MAG: hypothetical protein Q9214_005608 [Letrouitia sp. 1 TL-2023]